MMIVENKDEQFNDLVCVLSVLINGGEQATTIFVNIFKKFRGTSEAGAVNPLGINQGYSRSYLEGMPKKLLFTIFILQRLLGILYGVWLRVTLLHTARV